MAPFLTLNLIIGTVCWIFLATTALLIPPSSITVISIFLLITTLALYTTLSVAIYLVRISSSRRWQNKEHMFKSGRQPAAITAATSTLYLLLRILKAATLLNTILLIAIAALVTVYLQNRKIIKK